MAAPPAKPRVTSAPRSLPQIPSRPAATGCPGNSSTPRGLRTRAKAGADFHALALEHTDREDKLVDLGWFKRDDFMEEFDVIMFSLDDGEISPVFASHCGFHLAQLTGHRTPAPLPFHEVQPTVIDRITAEHRQSATQALVAERKSKAEIRDESKPAVAHVHEGESAEN